MDTTTTAQELSEFQEWLAYNHGEDVHALSGDEVEERWSEWKRLQRGDDGAA
jgi:hypothetical protein